MSNASIPITKTAPGIYDHLVEEECEICPHSARRYLLSPPSDWIGQEEVDDAASGDGRVGVTMRHVWRLLVRLREQGGRSVIRGPKGRSSARRIAEETERQAVQILSSPVYEDFGPTLAAEYLRKRQCKEAVDDAS
jgi:hypothetical protein